MVLAALLSTTPSSHADSLRGSRSSLLQQNRVARQHDYSYLRTPGDVRRFVAAGYLVAIHPTLDLELADVSFPYARPEVKTFLERLGAQYRSACGERLVVTSLTRPQTRQPRNASKISVHPTGMAIDLRRPKRASCRSWLERVLLALERRDVLDATRERWPPHYHVALFPEPYVQYVARMSDDEPDAAEETVVASLNGEDGTYEVQRGDSLWTISQRHGVKVADLRAVNELARSSIRPGQTLRIPGAVAGSTTETETAETAETAETEVATTVASLPRTDVLQTAVPQTAAPESLVLAIPVPEVVAAVASSADEGDTVSLQPTSYRVQRGDSLWAISQSHGVSVRQLRAVNELARTRLRPGETLKIPAPDSEEARIAANAAIAYRVRPGDSLWSISRSHGVSLRELRAANDLARARIHPGQVLRIPASETVAVR